jgi:hypothetical protein
MTGKAATADASNLTLASSDDGIPLPLPTIRRLFSTNSAIFPYAYFLMYWLDQQI